RRWQRWDSALVGGVAGRGAVFLGSRAAEPAGHGPFFSAARADRAQKDTRRAPTLRGTDRAAAGPGRARAARGFLRQTTPARGWRPAVRCSTRGSRGWPPSVRRATRASPDPSPPAAPLAPAPLSTHS